MGAMLRPAAAPPITRKREFWVLVGHAVALGVFGALAALVSLGVIKFGGRWGTVSRPGWFGGLGLCIAILIAKMFTYAVSQGSGFVGGPIFPSLFIGGTAGVIVHQAVPGVPLGLAFSCLLTAVLGSLAAAPFSMVLMAVFLTRVGVLQTAPILIAVVTAFLGVEGVNYLLPGREQRRSRRPSRPGL